MSRRRFIGAIVVTAAWLYATVAPAFPVQFRLVSRVKTATPSIFATSQTFDGNLKASYNGQTFTTGREGADYRCTYLANQAGLQGPHRALLCGSDIGARAYAPIAGVLKNRNGQTVATGTVDLWDGTLAAAVNYNEYGTLITTGRNILTGCTSAGMQYNASYTCSDYTTSSGNAYWGESQTSGGGWIAGSGGACSSTYRLYCVAAYEAPALQSLTAVTGAASAGDVDLTLELPADTSLYAEIKLRRLSGLTAPAADCNGASDTVVKTWTSSLSGTLTFTDAATSGDVFSYRACAYDAEGNILSSRKKTGVRANGAFHQIFVTSTLQTGSLGGLGGADAACAARAAAAGLSGGWKAVMSTTTVNAKARATVTGKVYNTKDEVVATSSADLWDGSIAAKAGYDEFGADVGAQVAITGSSATGSYNGSSTCGDWTVTTGNALVGSVNSLNNWVWNGSTQPCATAGRIYCLK